MVSHWLLVETIVFPSSYVIEGLSVPLIFWDAVIPTSISYAMSVTFLVLSFSVFISCSFLFSVPASLCRCKELSVQQRPVSQPEHMRITASTRRILVLFPPHKTSVLLPSGLMTARWRRAVEYGQIKQRRFALVRVR